MPVGGHLAAQITRAKRPWTTIYHRTLRCTAYRFSIPLSFWFCHSFRLVLLLALSLHDRPFEAKRASASEIECLKQLPYIEHNYNSYECKAYMSNFRNVFSSLKQFFVNNFIECLILNTYMYNL